MLKTDGMLKDDAKYEISAAAYHAADTVLKHFDIVPKRGGKVAPTQNNLAILIDVCTEIFRVEAAMDHLLRQSGWQNRSELASNLDRLRDAIRLMEIVRNRLPSFGDVKHRTVPAWQKEGIARELTADQRREGEKVSSLLAAARTPEEEQRILRQAGIIR